MAFLLRTMLWLLLCHSISASAVDWPVSQGNPARNSYVPVSIDVHYLQPVWQYQHIPSYPSIKSFVAADGQLFVVDNAWNLFSLNADNGLLLWQKSGQNFGYPVYDAGSVYLDYKTYNSQIFQYESTLLKLDSHTGEQQAEIFTGQDAGGAYGYSALVSTDKFIKGTWQGTGQVFSAFSTSDLSKIWESSEDGSSYRYSSDGQSLYWVDFDGLCAVDLAAAAPQGCIDAAISNSGEFKLPVIGIDHDAYLIRENALLAFDLLGKNIVWARNDVYSGDPVVVGGVVYAFNHNGLSAIDKQTGDTLWFWEIPQGYARTILVTNTHVFVSTTEKIYAISLKTRQYEWEYSKAGKLIISGDYLYIADDTGIHAIKLNSADTDGDNSPDVSDRFLLNPAASIDDDYDGMPEYWSDGCDATCQSASGLVLDDDRDFDGILNVADNCELAANADQLDLDADGMGNACDADIDNDGYINADDTDDDNDGVANGVDAFPLDPAASADTDGDKKPDAWNVSCLASCQSATDLQLDDDDDGDGLVDARDAYPRLPFQTIANATWGNYQANPAHNGFVPVDLDMSQTSNLWETDFKYVKPMLAAQGNVYFTDSSASSSGYLFALDAQTGVQRWKSYLSYLPGNSNYLSAYSSGTIYVRGSSGVAAWNAVTGDSLFATIAIGSSSSNVMAVLASDGSVYAKGDYGYTEAYNGVSGVKLWGSAIAADRLVPALDSRNLYIFNNGGLTAFNRSGGQKEFSVTDGFADCSQYDDSPSSPVLGENHDVFVITKSQSKSCLLGFDTIERKLKWKLPGNFFGQPAYADGVIYAAMDIYLVAIAADTGQVMWVQSLEKGSSTTMLAPIGNIIVTQSHIFASTDGGAYALDRYTHQVVWSYPRGGVLTIGQGGLYIASRKNDFAGLTTGKLIGIKLTQASDRDGDSMPDSRDEFPDNPFASVDRDHDGFPEHFHDGCDASCQSASGLLLDSDIDQDSVVDGLDNCVDVANPSQADLDADGAGDACDDDIDNDGVANAADRFPGNPAASMDADGDGLPDAWLPGCDSGCQLASGLALDTDIDNDGVPNDSDLYPLSYLPLTDNNHDGVPELALRKVWDRHLMGGELGARGSAVVDLDGDGTQEIVLSRKLSSADPTWEIMKYMQGSKNFETVWASTSSVDKLKVVVIENRAKILIAGKVAGHSMMQVWDGKTLAMDRELVLDHHAAVDQDSNRPVAILYGDIDNDGQQEISVVCAETTEIFDAETWTYKTSLVIAAGWDAALGNVDADPANELVLESGRIVEIHGKDISDEWNVPLYHDRFYSQVALADVDGDGMQEVVRLSGYREPGTVYVIDVDTRSIKFTMGPDYGQDGLLLADVTGDGREEIIFGNQQGKEIYAYDGASGQRLWTLDTPNSIFRGHTAMMVGDANGDGNQDLVFSQGFNSVGGNDPLFSYDITSMQRNAVSERYLLGPFYGVTTGDANNDGRLDLLIAAAQSGSGDYTIGSDGAVIEAYDAENFTREWSSHAGLFPGGNARYSSAKSLLVTDADHDSHSELVVAYDADGSYANNNGASLRWLAGLSDTILQEKYYTAISPIVYTLKQTDIEHDGETEILVGEGPGPGTAQPGAKLYMVNGRTGALKWVGSGSQNGLVSAIETADINHDGYEDVVAVVNGSLELIDIHNKMHRLGIKQLYGLSDFTSLAMTDIDGDSQLDIIAGYIENEYGIASDAYLALVDPATLQIREKFKICTKDSVSSVKAGSSAVLKGTIQFACGAAGMGVFDWSTKQVVWRSEPLPGAGAYNNMQVYDVGTTAYLVAGHAIGVTAYAFNANDSDLDGITNDIDNCLDLVNPTQLDTDSDGHGDACDGFKSDAGRWRDADRDGIEDSEDNCPSIANPLQQRNHDYDNDGLGDACDNDSDNDGVANDVDRYAGNASASVDDDVDGMPDEWNQGCDALCQQAGGLALDNCLNYPSTNISDYDNDGLGDVCDQDDDGDGVYDDADVFPFDASEAHDFDTDGIGDNADLDDDNDGIGDLQDNCPFRESPDQSNFDGDSLGDACDPDDDNDSFNDDVDIFPFDPAEVYDLDADGIGDTADPDDDNDLIADGVDNCYATPNTDQIDTDSDGWGNACDTDDDGDSIYDIWDKFPLDRRMAEDGDDDGIPERWTDWCESTCQNESGLHLDNCIYVANPDQLDTDGDGAGNACDDDDDGDGVPDDLDRWPLLTPPFEDPDDDGIASNIDIDDDGDGVPDALDAFPLDETASADTDGDGLADFLVNPRVENFELTNPTHFDWMTGGGTQVWAVGTEAARSGAHSARINLVNGPVSGALQVTTRSGNFVEFYNSHGYSDDLQSYMGFYVDGELVNLNTPPYAGEFSWKMVRVSVKPGVHTFTWLVDQTCCSLTDGREVYERYFVDDINFGQVIAEDLDDDNDGLKDIDEDYVGTNPRLADTDGDGVGDKLDNCRMLANADQLNTDRDAVGNVCDADDDNDGVPDVDDAFPLNANETLDADHDGIGNNLDADDDNDGVNDSADKFPLDPRETLDSDNDGVGNNSDNCPFIVNSDQLDGDNDSVGDVCDPFPVVPWLLVDKNGERKLSQLGFSVSAADFDHDGFADIVASSPYDDVLVNNKLIKDAGSIGIYSAVDGHLIRSFHGAVRNGRFGYAIDTVADQNGDLMPDLLVGDPFFTDPFGASLAGRIALYSGADGSFLREVARGDRSGARFGAAVATGDFDADGVIDLVVGVPSLSSPGSKDRVGAVIVYKGLGAQQAYIKYGAQSGERFGSALSVTEGGEVLVGSPGFDAKISPLDKLKTLRDAGRIQLVNLDVATPLLVQDGQNPGDMLGAAVGSFRKDVDGDSLGDWAVGAPGTDVSYINDQGRKIIYRNAGKIFLMSGAVAKGELSGAVGNAMLGASLCTKADLDGDSTNDLVFSEPLFNSPVTVNGKLRKLKFAGKIVAYSGVGVFAAASAAQ